MPPLRIPPANRALAAASSQPPRPSIPRVHYGLALRAGPSRLFSCTPTSLLGGYKQPLLDPPIPTPSSDPPYIPPYPPGPRRVYKQSNSGLYGNARIRFGNTIAPEYGNKSRRKWRPNVQSRRLWSESLGVRVRTKVTTRVLRSIDKVGGLDEYLLGSKPARIAELGPWGWKLRWRIMQTDAIKDRFARQREALGLPPLELDGILAGEGESQGLPVEAAEGALTREALLEETQRVIDGEEIELGLDEQEEFMKEEKPVRSS